jgi:hypothetical protein
MDKRLVNTADLRILIASKVAIEATAKAPESVEGFLLHIKTKKDDMVLSTYLSDKPRLFKRADALLKEATKVGLSSVRFELANNE